MQRSGGGKVSRAINVNSRRPLIPVVRQSKEIPMATYITLASRNSPSLMPMTRDGSTITIFVFSSPDNAIAFGNKFLKHNNDEWITRTHDKNSIDTWLSSAQENDGATHASVDPDHSGRPRVIPIDVLRAVVRMSP